MLLNTYIADNSPYIDILDLSSTYSRFKIVGQGIRPTTVDPTSVTLVSVMRRLDQPNFDIAGYHWRTTTQDSGSTIFDNRQSHTSQFIEITNLNVLNATSPTNELYPVDFELLVQDPGNDTFYKQLSWTALWTNSGMYKNRTEGNAVNLRSEAMDGIRFAFTSGNIRVGTFKVYGLD